ncbi:MAG: roadblock/LC7 domain-containing protein [Candidatus Micrarchaeia archaeon]
MQSKQFVFMFILLLAIALAGCFEKTLPLPQKKAMLESSKTSDIDKDGIPDEWYYSYKPETLDGFKMKREIYIQGMTRNPSFAPQKYYVRNEQKAEEYYNQLTLVATLVPQCTYAIDEVIPCGSVEECHNLCAAKVRCNNGLNKYPGLNASIYELSVGISNIRENALRFRTLIASKSSLSQAELESILTGRDTLVGSINKLLSNDIFTNLLCSPTELERTLIMLESIEDMYQLDTQKTESQYVDAYTTYKIISKTSFSYDENAVVEIDEPIPQSFAPSRASITFITPPKYVSDSVPITARYLVSFKKVEQTKADIAYEVETSSKGWADDVGAITYPSGTIRILELESFGPYVLFQNIFYGTLNFLRQYIGFGFAISITVFITLLILYLFVTLVRIVYSVFISMGRHESLKEALYRVAGHGGKGRLELFALAVISLVVGFYVIRSAGEPVGENILLILASNNSLLVGTLVFSIGFFSLYFITSDVVKGIILGPRYFRAPTIVGVRKVVVEKELKEELDKMRMSLLKLEEDAKVSGITLPAGNVEEFMQVLEVAEKMVNEGKLDEAEAYMSKHVRKKYTALHEQLSVGINLQTIVSKMRGEIEDEISHIEQIYRKAKSYDIGFEWVDWRGRADKYNDVIKSAGYDGAKRYLAELLQELRKEASSIQNKISEVEHLRLSRFPCPVCGNMTSLAHEECEKCGVSLKEGFLGRLDDLKHELESVAMELHEKKIVRSEKIISSTETLLSHLQENINTGKYDKAAELIPTISEKIKHLQEVLGKVVALEVECSNYENEIKRYTSEIPVLLDEAKSYGIDVSQYEKRFVSLNNESRSLEISKLPVEEAYQKLKEFVEFYGQVESSVKVLISKYKLSVNAVEQINTLFTEISKNITRAKGFGLEVSEYTRRLSEINIDVFMDEIEKGGVDEKDLLSMVDMLNSMGEELKKKLLFVQQFGESIARLEEKVSNAKALADECKGKGLYPYDEMEFLYAPGINRLKERLRTLKLDEIDAIRSEIARIDTNLSNVIFNLRKKRDILSLWPSWKSTIQNILKKQDYVEPSSVSTIPPEWRPWAFERFVEETDIPVALEANRIVKLKSLKGISKSDIDQVLDEMIASGKIQSGMILRKDGLVISSRMPEGIDSEHVAAMTARAMQKSVSASSSFGKGDVQYVMFGGSSGRLVMVRAGDQAIVLAIIKPEEDLGFVILSLKNMGDKVANLIEKL